VRGVNADRTAADGPEVWYYGLDEAARRLCVSRRTVREMIDYGQLPGVRLGRTIVIPRAALDAFLEAAKQAAS